MFSASAFHAHVYFNEDTIDTARKLCKDAGYNFILKVGSFHEKPVGPHPMWSCQLAFADHQFGALVPWLALNRKGLTVFIHPITGDHLKDHTAHAIWMGTMQELDTSIFVGL